MEPMKHIEEAIKKKLHATASAALHDRVLARVRHADEQSRETIPALHEPIIRRMIMKAPIVRLAIAAAVIAVVGLGILAFIGTGSKSGVVWAEVVRKVEASRGLIVRNTDSIPSSEDDYTITYTSPRYCRKDF